jgi:hypothetical protein
LQHFILSTQKLLVTSLVCSTKFVEDSLDDVISALLVVLKVTLIVTMSTLFSARVVACVETVSVAFSVSAAVVSPTAPSIFALTAETGWKAFETFGSSDATSPWELDVSEEIFIKIPLGIELAKFCYFFWFHQELFFCHWIGALHPTADERRNEDVKLHFIYAFNFQMIKTLLPFDNIQKYKLLK